MSRLSAALRPWLLVGAALATSLFFHTTALANQLILGAGSQAREHPLDLRTYNLIWQRNFSRHANGWQADWEVDLGKLHTNEGDATWGGFGMGINYAVTPHARFRLGGRISYLDRYEFIYEDDESVLRLRSYGGHRQFSVSASLIWHMGYGKGPGLGYRFEHMSNAYLYNSNPGIDTHNLVLFIPFGGGD